MRPFNLIVSLAVTGLAIAVPSTGSASPATTTTTPAAPHPATLTTTKPLTEQDFGFSTAVSGTTVVVGALSRGSGRAEIYTRPRYGWHSATQTAELVAPGPADVNYRYGYSVAVSGNTVVVGARDEQIGSSYNVGSAYVYVKPDGGWKTTNHPTATLTPPTDISPGAFGGAVAISGKTIVVGAYSAKVGSNASQGAAYVYSEPSGGWRTTSDGAVLTASDGSANDDFGTSVAIDGSVIVVGAPVFASEGQAGSGGAYEFDRPPAGWKTATESAELLEPQPVDNNAYGSSVAVQGSTVMVGATGETNGTHRPGAVFVFTRPKSGWAGRVHTSTLQLKPSDAATIGDFGGSISLSGNTVAVGAPNGTADGLTQAGAVYLFAEPKSGWATTSHSLEVTEPTPKANDKFGIVALSGAVLAVGADFSGSTNEGRAYVYAPPAPTATVSESVKKWTKGKHSTKVNPHHKPHGGTTFKISLNQAATVSFDFTEKKQGHLKHKGTVTVHAKAGTTKLYVDGPLGHGHKLKPGKCKVTVTASNANGDSATKTLRFTVT